LGQSSKEQRAEADSPQNLTAIGKTVLVYAAYAACLPLITWVVFIFASDIPVNFRSISRIHEANTALYIVDLIPLVTGLIAFLLSKTMNKRLEDAFSQRDQANSQNVLLELTMDSIDQGIIVRDEAGNIILFNHRLTELTGVEPEVFARNATEQEIFETQSKAGITGVVTPEIVALIDNWKKKRAETGSLEKLSYVRQLPGGNWLLATRQALESGHEIRTFLDITDQKLAEDEAIAHAVILQHTLDNMGQGLTVYDSEWNLRTYNKRYQEHFDLPEDTLSAAQTFDDVVGATMRRDYGEAEAKERLNVVRDPTRMTDLWRREFMRPTGRYLDVISNPIPDGGFVVTSTDVTEQKKSEAIIAQKEVLLKTVIDNMSDGVFALDAELSVTMFNERYLDLAEITDKLIAIGKPIREVVLAMAEEGYYGPGDPQELTDQRLVQFETDDYVESEITAHDGRYVHVRKSALEEGGAVVTLTDITKRKTAELEINLAMAEAEAANRVKSQFLANMSHEIRTPLSAISGFLELLELSPLEDEQRQHVKRASTAAATLLEIIGDVLDFSKIEAGHFDTSLSDVPVTHTVLEIVSVLSPRATEQGNKISVQVAPEVSRMIRTDALRLKQVLMNITGNAIKFTHDGLIHISVEPENHPAEDGSISKHVRFNITDTGIGFDNSNSGQVFEEFAQAEESTTRRFGGTGLGLAISKRLVELMGGRIGNYGEAGNGAEFWFTLPSGNSAKSSARKKSSIDARIVAWQHQADDINVTTLQETYNLQKLHMEEVTELAEIHQINKAQADIILLSTPFMERACKIGEAFGEGSPSIRILISSSSKFQNRQLAFRSGFTHLISFESAKTGLDEYIMSASLGSIESDLGEQLVDANVDSLIAEVDPALRHLPVLLIDDLEMNRIIASRQIERLGLNYETAENGERGLAKATTNDYAMVIVDCSMPVMDGFQFTEQFRKWEAGNNRERHTPVIAMTANATVGDAERCIASGMDDYMAKPASLQRIAEMAARWLAPGIVDGLGPSRWSVAPKSGQSQSEEKQSYPAPINLKTLAQAAASDDAKDHLEMLAIFREAWLDILSNIDRAFADSDDAAMREQAHAGAGAAANIGATQLSVALKGVEVVSPETDRRELTDLLNNVHVQSRHVLEMIDVLESKG
jgi:signal transduction histidine kinase/CheY-like chemotaxis protein/HPt (histidine-containing phosphotransfer) domain-containing protein